MANTSGSDATDGTSVTEDPADAPTPITDGRTLRRRRNRDSVITAPEP